MGVSPPWCLEKTHGGRRRAARQRTIQDAKTMSRRVILPLLLLSILAAGILLWFFYWGNPFTDSFSPGALHDYLPSDTAAVIAIDVKQWRDKGLLNQPLGEALVSILTKPDLGLPLSLANIDSRTDLDEVRLAFSPRDLGRPLVLLRGRFDRARFQTGPGQLQEIKENGFRLYHHQDADRNVTLALAGDTLIASVARPRVLDALHHAKGRPSSLGSPRMTALLQNVNRSSAAWVAAEVHKLGKPSSNALLQPFVSAVFEDAETVRGEVSGSHGLAVDLLFECPNEPKCAKLTATLQAAPKIIGLGVLLTNDPTVTLMKPFTASTVEQQGKTVRVHCLLIER